MVGSVTQSKAQPVSFEEEALKRNTDCVYFLASPLTCKKGSECEYRHSDIARLNPRDCWYWLNSTCLNPKCAFRHPPLEGLLGMQTPASSGPSASLPQIVTTSIPQSANVTAKPGVPCVFFQKGHCLKGDWCTFQHVPSPSSNKHLPISGSAPVTEPATGKAASTGAQKSVQEKKVFPAATAKAMKNIPEKKATSNFGPTHLGSQFGINNRAELASGINELHGYSAAPFVSDGSPGGLSGRVKQSHLLDEPESMNGMDPDEVSREPSPGFDVLVDDEGRDTDYYPREERYGTQRDHESRSEFDIGRPNNDYNMIAAIDDERYQDALAYDSQEQQKGVYEWEQRRASAERLSGGSYYERNAYARPDAFGQIDELDLRHRLAKHKRPNGLRSVISHEYSNDMQAGGESYQGVQRDDLRTSIRESSLSSRLRGRIRLPRRSPSPSDRDPIRRNTDRGGLSPLTSRTASVQGRIQDRIKGRVEEPFSNGGKNYRGLHRDAIGDMNVEFVGPKRLAELKNKKNEETSVEDVIDQGSLGKRKHFMGDVYQQSGSDLSFEGPKSLQEILKRKRGETNGSTGGRASSNTEAITEDKNQEVAKEATDTDTTTLSGVNEEIAVTSASTPTLQTDASNQEVEDPRSVEYGEDQEYEAYEQRDGDDDYEQGGGEDADLYDENGEAVEEYVDDEDDDEFAKKMGVVYS